MEPDQVSIIDTPDVGEAHPAPAKSPCIDDLGYSAATEDDSGKIHPHFIATTRSATTISDVVDTFLSNIKLRFGVESSEVATIFNVLGAFRAGKTSKKDTLIAIQIALGSQQDLKQDLMNILFHGDADWGTGDFDFSCHQSFNVNPPSPSPRFLQPTHQPQMQLPSISPAWFEGSQAYLPSIPATTGGYVGNLGYGQSASPATLQTLGHFSNPNAFTSPHLAEPTSYDHHLRESYETEMGAQSQHFDRIPQLSHVQPRWERIEHQSTHYYAQPWSSEAFNPMLGRAQPFASHHVDPSALSYEQHPREVVSSQKATSAAASPSILGVPIAVPVGQLLDDFHKPSRKRRRQNLTTHFQPRDDSHEDVETGSNLPTHAPNNIPLTLSTHPRTEQKEDQTREGVGGGPYIHSLCGKSFSTRSRVKKHHWGIKMDDLETTTGCWAKNKKPNVSWNEHPSCREALTATKKATPAVKRQRPSKKRAPSVSSLEPTPHNLLQASTTPHGPHGEAFTLRHPVSYHMQGLPGRTSFDNLLTAVNVAAQVDAPQPQGRIDSVVSQLDAQAAAMERNRQYVTKWQNTSGGSEKGSAHGQHHPYTAQGLGISYPLAGMHRPLDAALPTQWGAHTLTPSSGSPKDGNWDHAGIRTFDDMRDSGTTL